MITKRKFKEIHPFTLKIVIENCKHNQHNSNHTILATVVTYMKTQADVSKLCQKLQQALYGYFYKIQNNDTINHDEINIIKMFIRGLSYCQYFYALFILSVDVIYRIE